MKGYSRYFWAIHFIGDIVIINLAFFLNYYLKFETLDLNDNSQDYQALFLIFNFIWVFTAFSIKLYDIQRVTRLDRVIFNLFKAGVINGVSISAILFLSKESDFSREHLYVTYISLFVVILIWRFFIIKLIYIIRKSGFNYKTVIIIGHGELAKKLYTYFNSDTVLGFKLVGIFSDGIVGFDVKDKIINGNLDDMKVFVKSNKIDEMYYTMPLADTDNIKKFINYTDRNMIRFRIVPDFRGFPFKRVNIDFYHDNPIISFRKEPLIDIMNRLIKRLFDIIFALFIIVFVLSWLYPIIAFLIKISSKGPILFKQVRSGLDNAEFLCFKFRSMKINTEQDSKQATHDDIRTTKIGSFLRRTSLDELPQFINVLFGDMSVVGPRPHMLRHTEEYSRLINKYMVRQLVKPGITGMAQIRGYRGETKELKDMEGRVRIDVWYIENWSIWLDINIILLTIIKVVKGDEKAF